MCLSLGVLLLFSLRQPKVLGTLKDRFVCTSLETLPVPPIQLQVSATTTSQGGRERNVSGGFKPHLGPATMSFPGGDDYFGNLGNPEEWSTPKMVPFSTRGTGQDWHDKLGSPQNVNFPLVSLQTRLRRVVSNNTDSDSVAPRCMSPDVAEAAEAFDAVSACGLVWVPALVLKSALQGLLHTSSALSPSLKVFPLKVNELLEILFLASEQSKSNRRLSN